MTKARGQGGGAKATFGSNGQMDTGGPTLAATLGKRLTPRTG